MEIKSRFLHLVEVLNLSPKNLEDSTGIDRYRWQNLLNKETQKVTEEHLTAIKTAFPQYIYWLVTGDTLPEAGQISPDIERKRKDSKRAGKDG